MEINLTEPINFKNKKRNRNKKNLLPHPKKKLELAFIGSPFVFLIFAVFLAVVYDGNLDSTIKALAFSILTMIWLIPLLIVPVVNFLLLPFLTEIQDFTIICVNKFAFFEADSFTWYFTITIAILYIICNIIITIATITVISYNIGTRKDRIPRFIQKTSGKPIKRISKVTPVSVKYCENCGTKLSS